MQAKKICELAGAFQKRAAAVVARMACDSFSASRSLARMGLSKGGDLHRRIRKMSSSSTLHGASTISPSLLRPTVLKCTFKNSNEGPVEVSSCCFQTIILIDHRFR